jgi:hypothetical protein
MYIDINKVITKVIRKDAVTKAAFTKGAINKTAFRNRRSCYYVQQFFVTGLRSG